MLYSILNGQGISFINVLVELLASLMVIIVVLPFHELAHGFVAYKLGDDTAKRANRLTFNPIHHLNYLGALCLILVGFGWADPVPVDPRNFKHPKRDMALVALAGPVANLIAALVGALLFNAFITFVPYSTGMLYMSVSIFLQYYISVNIGLAVFNLIPLPPLDGSKILGAFLPEKTYVKMLMNERMLSMILLLLIFLNVVDKLVTFPRILLESFIFFIGSLPFIPFH